MTVEVMLTILGMIVAAGTTGGGIVYGYGRLTSRAEYHEQNINGMSDDLQDLKQIVPTLREAVSDLKRILSNGVTGKVNCMEQRMARMEQHCADMHGQLTGQYGGQHHSNNGSE